MHPVILSFLAILLLGCGGVHHASPTPADTVRNFMERRAGLFLENPVVNALSIGVHRAGVNYSGHFGEIDPGAQNAPTVESLFEIASVTKTFTGALAAQAVLDGKFDLDTDIRSLLDGHFPNLEFEGEPIRVWHLLSHTAGLPANNKPLEDLAGDNADGTLWREVYEAEKDYTKEAFLRDLREHNIASRPGEVFLYSNVSANLMGHILERAYGASFEHLLKTKILAKAHMHDTFLRVGAEESGRIVNGYNGEGLPMPFLPLADTLWGAEGALKSTLSDMMKYAEFMLDDANPLVSELRRKFKKLDDGYWVGYFWWAIDVNDDVTSYRHDGGAIGTRGVFILYPDYDMAIYAVTNNASETIFPALSKLVDGLREDLKPKAEG